MLTGGGDEAAIARGIFDTYQHANLRYSQMAPLDMWDEVNTGTNLPAEIKIAAVDGDAYKFLFMAKGGGSANKSYLFQETKALLNPTSLLDVPRREAAHARHRGLPAVPPGRRHRRHVGRVRARDRQARLGPLPRHAAHRRATSSATASATSSSRPRCSSSPRHFGIGAQFGGKYFCHDVRVIRLPRHGASCPVGHRRVVLGRPPGARQDHRRRRVPRAARDATRPSTCPRSPTTTSAATSSRIDLNRPMDEIRAELSQVPGQDPPVAHRPAGRGPRHRPRQDQGAPRRRRAACRSTCGTTPSTTPARPRRPRATPRARSGPPPPAAWTPTSTSSRPPAAAS